MRTKNIVGTIFCTLGVFAGLIAMSLDSGALGITAVVLILIGIVAYCWRTSKVDTAVDVLDAVVDAIDF